MFEPCLGWTYQRIHSNVNSIVRNAFVYLVDGGDGHESIFVTEIPVKCFPFGGAININSTKKELLLMFNLTRTNDAILVSA